MKAHPLLSLALVTLLTFNLGSAQAADKKAAPKAKKPNPAMADIKDVPGLPRVLIIGDSISIGYTLPTRKNLEGVANVHRIPTNGGPTINGLAHLKQWLGDSKWDVIHFNWGLHDLKYMPDNTHQVSTEDYEKNLSELVKTLKATGAKLIWCSTTPVPDAKTNPMRKNEDVITYNKIAAKIMKENGIETDDLYSYALPKLAEIQLPANVHYKPEGYAYLAEKVASSIKDALPKK